MQVALMRRSQEQTTRIDHTARGLRHHVRPRHVARRDGPCGSSRLLFAPMAQEALGDFSTSTNAA